MIRRGMLSRIIPVIYLIVGVVIAAQHDYFQHLNTIGHILSAVLAVALWPLILFGVDLNVG